MKKRGESCVSKLDVLDDILDALIKKVLSEDEADEGGSSAADGEKV